jgi:hypothetical protein
MFLITQTHTQQYNEPYRVVLNPVRSLTHSPTPPLKDQSQNVGTIVTGCKHIHKDSTLHDTVLTLKSDPFGHL